LATQVNSIVERRGGEGSITILNITLITSGTTTTYTFPAGIAPLIHGFIFLNRTTGVPTAGGTYTPSTGVYVSPTMAVNDVADTTFFAD
jgi:hypothetical protein